MTKATDTSESTVRYGIFRDDASAFTEATSLRGIVYENETLAQIALDDLKQELSASEHAVLGVRKVAVTTH